MNGPYLTRLFMSGNSLEQLSALSGLPPRHVAESIGQQIDREYARYIR